MSERLLTARELAELLGFSSSTVQDWAERGEVPAFKLGGRLRFRLSEVETWLEAQRLGTAVPANPIGLPEVSEISDTASPMGDTAGVA